MQNVPVKPRPRAGWFSLVLTFVGMGIHLCLLTGAKLPSFGPATPSITTQPADRTVAAGRQAIFIVSAKGTAPLTYQWQKNGTNISGATSPILRTAPATSADNGSTYRAIVSNPGGSVAAKVAMLAATNSVPQWSVYELPLTATRSYENPYTDLTVTAVFVPPPDSGLIAKTVQGFWDGDSQFRVRFTPTCPGTWTYSISSSPKDPGLTVNSGSITVVPPTAGEHGFLRRDPEHPYHFVFDDGAHYFMMGQTYYNIIENVAAGGSWQTAIYNCKALGFSKVRILLYSWGPVYDGNGLLYPDIIPYGFGSFGRASARLNHGSIGDHDQINLAFWDDLDALVNYLHDQNMIADLILFNDVEPSYGQGLHEGTPGRTQNERYIKYALARLAGQTNVIWCMANEYDYVKVANEVDTERVAIANGYSDGPGYTAADAQMNDLGAILKTNDPYFVSDSPSLGSAPRILSTHQHSQPHPFRFLWWNLADTLGASWFSAASIQQHVQSKEDPARADVNANAAIIANLGHNMPVVNEEYGYLDMGMNTRTLARNVIWAIVVGGGYGTFGGDATTPCETLGCPAVSGNWAPRLYYGDIRNLVSFMQTTNYWERTPANDKITLQGIGARAYASGSASNSTGGYIVYVAQPAGSGPTFQFNESPESACTVVDQLDPRTNQLTHLGPMGGAFSITTPDTISDYVYHLYGGTCGQ